MELDFDFKTHINTMVTSSVFPQFLKINGWSFPSFPTKLKIAVPCVRCFHCCWLCCVFFFFLCSLRALNKLKCLIFCPKFFHLYSYASLHYSGVLCPEIWFADVMTKDVFSKPPWGAVTPLAASCSYFLILRYNKAVYFILFTFLYDQSSINTYMRI